MINYDKQEVREALTTEDVFELVSEFGGNPQYTNFGFTSETIDHNLPGEGSRKLYYYENSTLFTSYTSGSDAFDVFELTMKVFKIQHDQEIDLNDAVRFVAFKFGISGTDEADEDSKDLEDWSILSNYDRIENIEVRASYSTKLKAYDPSILDRFVYNVNIGPWLDEGISQEVMNRARIGYYPGDEQITIPHFDEYGRLIGLRGRALCKEDADLFGKYRPIRVGAQLYNHPLGMTLYNFDKSKENIRKARIAILFEGKR